MEKFHILSSKTWLKTLILLKSLPSATELTQARLHLSDNGIVCVGVLKVIGEASEATTTLSLLIVEFSRL